jgi:hypothetical protein
MARTLKPNEFTVFCGQKKWSGEEIVKFFNFDPAKCKIEVKEFGLHITQDGCDSLILGHGLEITEIKEVNPLDRFRFSDEIHP